MVVKSGNLFFDDGNRIGHLLSMDGTDDTKDECEGEEGFHEIGFSQFLNMIFGEEGNEIFT